MLSNRASALVIGAILTLVASGCSQTRWEEPAPERASKPSPTKKRSERGNPPFYEVFGKRYYVMAASDGYRERGIASWYGKKFHGRRTSSGEIYDMYAMTAAHKSLPLPTRVRVKHLGNGRSIVVRVNDRGPFVGDRIIDLSYAAAKQLGMIRDGTARVEVTALPDSSVAKSATGRSTMTASRVFMQVGAFGVRTNAEQLMTELTANGITKATIHTDTSSDPAVYRVRVGPLSGVAEYDRLAQRVAALDISAPHLVVEPESEPVGTSAASGI